MFFFHQMRILIDLNSYQILALASFVLILKLNENIKNNDHISKMRFGKKEQSPIDASYCTIDINAKNFGYMIHAHLGSGLDFGETSW